MKMHLFKNDNKVSRLIDFTESVKGNRETVNDLIERILLPNDLRPTNIKCYVENIDPNDNERFSDNTVICLHSKTDDEFSFGIRSTLKQILDKIFDNTDDLDLFTITCTANSVAYKGLRCNNNKNGHIDIVLTILMNVSQSPVMFHTIRKYNINIAFDEVSSIS